MIRGKHIDKICIAIFLIGILVSSAIPIIANQYNSSVTVQAYKPSSSDLEMTYESKLFDKSYVHKLDIQVNEEAWELMADNAEEESYIPCSLVIDDELFSNVAIRPKGNSSLAMIQAMDSDKFSFKVEFGRYDANTTYYGLDKLALNNLGQDPSCMKDFIAYDMMNQMGVAAPLASYIYVTLNGEDFGLYLAVEGVEKAFSERNFGNSEGKLYKPDSLNFESLDIGKAMTSEGENPSLLDGLINMSTGEGYEAYGPGDRVDILADLIDSVMRASDISLDVSALKYIGDDPALYGDIFDNAVFSTSATDKNRLVKSLKQLNEGMDLEEIVDIDEVLRFLAVQNFVMNYDGYSSVFPHNYYLYEENGQMSMIPWDYNLGFGSFNAESVLNNIWNPEEIGFTLLKDESFGMDINVSMINYPIDEPTITISSEERPMIHKILEKDEYIFKYRALFNELVEDYFQNGYFQSLYNNTYEIIKPFILNGATSYSISQFEKGASAIYKFCTLRCESVQGQLNGTIPSTMEGQSENYELLISAHGLDLADMIDFSGIITALLGTELSEFADIFEVFAPEDSDGTIASVILNIKELIEEDRDFEIFSLCVKLINKSSLVRGFIWSAVSPILYFLAAIVFLIIAILQVSKFKRRKGVKNIFRSKVYDEVSARV